MTHIEAQEFYDLIYDVLKNEEFQKRRKYKHHGKITVYEHSIAVSKLSYIVAKKLNKDYKSAAIGGLLHDFYKEPWQNRKSKEKFLKKHGFTHAKDAMENSYKYFPHLMDKKVENIILRHMFPLNIIPPKYFEGWIVTMVDKYISLEVFKNPEFFYRLVGIQKKVGE